MRKYLLFSSILGMILLIGAGCSTNYDDYCCASNDLCSAVAEVLHSCSMDTCKCVAVEPITVAVVGDWKDPMVEQDNYRVELQATGGLPPYSWEDFAIANNTSKKMDWLTLKVDETDTNKARAWLTNYKENDNISVPTTEALIDEGLKITVTVKDHTKHGKKTDRVDNTGYPFEHAIMIKPSACESGDGFCPATCNISNDNDCAVKCGDGVLSTGEGGEICDTAIDAGQPGACPTQDDCNDGIQCTVDTLENPGTCTAACLHTWIAECKDGDNCCPVGCDNTNDKNCSATCGNSKVEDNETCDKTIAAGQVGACPTNCDDGNACTTDTLIGSADNCTAACSHQAITVCQSGDGCCPTGCHHDKDTDCGCKCGDGYIDTSCGETCDGNCPTSCDDGNKCTTDNLTGSAATCNVVCMHTAIHPCCGDGLVEGTETCDGNCPTTCTDDGNKCTNEVLTGSASTCNVVCTHPAITCTGCGSCNSANGNCEADQTKCSSGQICGGQNSCGPCARDQQCISGYGVGYVCKTGVCGKGNPLLQVGGSDMGAYYQNIDVSHEGLPIVDAQVTVNGTIIPNKSGEWYYGTLSSQLSVGAPITLKVTSGASTVIATSTIPEYPVLKTPSDGVTFASTDNITVTWTSSTNPDRFRVSATYSCGSGCGTGKSFTAVGAARTLTITAGSLPSELIISLSVFAYNDGSYTGDYAPGYGMNIRSQSNGIKLFINP